jgi:CRP/FNR family cyclic AMP-dependent transcriptional regulator
MSNRQPALALELTMALGAVIAKRMVNKPKRVAVT